MRKTLFTASLLAAALAAPLAQAHQAGDIIVRAGAITVDPREETSGVFVDRGGLAGTDLGGKASLDSDTQLGLNFAYMLTDHVGIELLAATPFQHDVSISGTADGIADGKLGELKHLPPTLSLVYYPMDSKSAFQPYVGAGVNYTWFFDESVGSAATAGGFDNFRVKNSWGWAAQVGMDYMLTDQIMVNAQVRYIDIDTDAYVDNTILGVRAKVDVEVDPMVYMVGLGYKF
ncbi:OmpW/AlkL family protein [Pseudomonas saudiphocaensis]|uniref:OmpW/AlkL family protein n=1 Tax=Pseudomonas saudiphocaensis TaxID=1499686 RepID=UPI000F79B2A0|nr:OmpW family outer membrane protein [Pseudomonas saudiphocaensis]RRV12604.1 outer membrane protein OmpW [Pseudomonas saudiphocaensis]